MTHHDLSDTELRNRLRRRGVDAYLADYLVANREERPMQARIEKLLGEEVGR